MNVSRPFFFIAIVSMLVGGIGITTPTPVSADSHKGTVGTLLGGVLGGVAGSKIGKGKGRTAGIIVGALGGAMIGGQIGKSMDENDRRISENTAHYGLETTRTGTMTSWQNPDSGNSGTFTPTSTYRSSQGEDCREYETTIYVDGQRETAYGRACRQPDGSWQIQP